MYQPKYFSLAELTQSATADRLGINNRMYLSFEVVDNLLVLAEQLDKIRLYIGEPIHITSGFRSHRLNMALPGSAQNSYHQFGMAVDMYCSGNLGLYNIIKNNFKFTELGFNKDKKYIHYAFNPRCLDGKIIY